MLALVTPACAPDPDEESLRASIQAVYDKETGRLREITYDSDQNGTIDTWTYMDGTAVLRIEIDQDEDGIVDRWEYFDEAQQLERVGFSRANDGVVDAWASEGPDGQIAKLEISTVRDSVVDRWEYYENDLMVRAKRTSAVMVKWISGKPTPMERSSRPRSTRMQTAARIGG